jgi:hypothetical protein
MTRRRIISVLLRLIGVKLALYWMTFQFTPVDLDVPSEINRQRF